MIPGKPETFHGIFLSHQNRRLVVKTEIRLYEAVMVWKTVHLWAKSLGHQMIKEPPRIADSGYPVANRPGQLWKRHFEARMEIIYGPITDQLHTEPASLGFTVIHQKIGGLKT
jgi:hypothetical protein